MDIQCYSPENVGLIYVIAAFFLVTVLSKNMRNKFGIYNLLEFLASAFGGRLLSSNSFLEIFFFRLDFSAAFRYTYKKGLKTEKRCQYMKKLLKFFSGLCCLFALACSVIYFLSTLMPDSEQYSSD